MQKRLVALIILLCFVTSIVGSTSPLIVNQLLTTEAQTNTASDLTAPLYNPEIRFEHDSDDIEEPSFCIIRQENSVEHTSSSSMETPNREVSGVVVNTERQIDTHSNSPLVPGNPADKAVINVLWYNDSSSNQTTWALASTLIDVQITLKGPFSNGDEILFDLVENVVLGVDVVWSQATYTFTQSLDEDQTITLIWNDVTLDPSPTFGYGDGNLQVDRYFINAFRWEFTGIIWQWVLFHDGSQDAGRFLWMWGGFHFTHTQWLNSTGEWVYTAKPGWQVTPYHFFEIIRGPVSNINLYFRLRYDVVWWFDENVPGGTALLTLSGIWLPGNYSVYWTSPFSLPTSRSYGTGFGKTRGIFDEVWKDALDIGTQLYHGGAEGYELFIVNNIPNQAPDVSILYPVDGQVIESSSISAYCRIQDPNAGYDVTQVTLYLNGAPTDITENYSSISEDASFTFSLSPSFSGILNMTVVAQDSTGLKGSDTVFLLVKLPTNAFPEGYLVNETDVTGNPLSYNFIWDKSLTWAPDENWNFTITPWVKFGFDVGSLIHVVYGLPESVKSGEEFMALFKVTDVLFSLNLSFQMGFDYYFRAGGNYTFSGSMTFISEFFRTMMPIDLGIELYDLRYDIPMIAPFMQFLTHFSVRVFDIIAFPIDWLVDLELSVDVVPILKFIKSLVCDVAGTNAQLSRSQLQWVDNEMLAMNCTADSGLGSSDLVEISLSNFILQTRVGMELGVELTLTGIVLGRQLPSINVNDWMYQHLGILIPKLDIWLLQVDVPLPGSTSLQIPVEEEQMGLDTVGVFASETAIQVTIFVHDSSGGAITGATVTGQIGATPYSATELGSGQYQFILPYTSVSFDLDITSTKTGFVSVFTTINIFIDPITVDETPPQISGTTNDPIEPKETETVTVTATIIDALTGVKNASLYYSVYTGVWTQIIMTYSGGLYHATIPSQSVGSSVRYYIEAFDNAGHRRASSVFTYTVQSATTTEPPPTTPEPPPTTTEPTTPPPPGIPGFPPLAIAIGFSLATIIGIIIRRRKVDR